MGPKKPRQGGKQGGPSVNMSTTEAKSLHGKSPRSGIQGSPRCGGRFSVRSLLGDDQGRRGGAPQACIRLGSWYVGRVLFFYQTEYRRNIIAVVYPGSHAGVRRGRCCTFSLQDTQPRTHRGEVIGHDVQRTMRACMHP